MEFFSGWGPRDYAWAAFYGIAGLVVTAIAIFIAVTGGAY